MKLNLVFGYPELGEMTMERAAADAELFCSPRPVFTTFCECLADHYCLGVGQIQFTAGRRQERGGTKCRWQVWRAEGLSVA